MTCANEQPIDWLGMSFTAPADWEIARHAVRPESGSLVFVDRRSQRMSVTWAACQSRPDTARALSDCRGKDQAGHPKAEFSSTRKRMGWAGYHWQDSDGAVARNGFYDGDNQRWIEVILSWPGGSYDAAAEEAMLRGFTTTEIGEGRARWRAFGLDVLAPGQWSLVKADVKPGEMTFSYQSAEGEVVVQRSRTAGGWFDGRLDALLRRRTKLFDLHVESGAWGRHEACRAQSLERKFHWRWFALDRRTRHDRVWECERSAAVYHVSATVRRTSPVRPESFEVRCCGE